MQTCVPQGKTSTDEKRSGSMANPA